MGKETERKFLVKHTGFKESFSHKYEVKQGYLSTEPKHVVRIRTLDGKGFITIKGRSSGLTRQEFEYEIPGKDALEMMGAMCSTLIEKFRYIVYYKGMKWEVDEFFNDNEGLMLAEIELDDEKQDFEQPSWLGAEVSNNEKYYNAYLINYPYKTWRTF
ncbi:MAG: CYTH domain-containing protein [Bacteroidales bacterium]|nr:CYTH domain-containing protein [Bacteroidales bacterium]MCF8332772.1 CYTH domain-containing protein [Bacteroidales bacterium]